MSFGRFSGDVLAKWLRHRGDDRDMELLEDFSYTDPDGKAWVAPKPVSKQPGHGRSTRMTLAEHLAQEHPKRHQRRVDPFSPNHARSIQRLRNDIR